MKITNNITAVTAIGATFFRRWTGRGARWNLGGQQQS